MVKFCAGKRRKSSVTAREKGGKLKFVIFFTSVAFNLNLTMADKICGINLGLWRGANGLDLRNARIVNDENFC
jgi:hypothetical protein